MNKKNNKISMEISLNIATPKLMTSIFLLSILLFIPLFSHISYGAEITINNPANESTVSSQVSSVTLNITTNESAQCEYSTSSFNFGSGTDFDNTGSTVHTTSYSVTAGNTYNLYYICNSTGDENRTTHHEFYTASELTIDSVEVSTGNESANITIETSNEANATIYYGTTEESNYSDYGSSSSIETSSKSGSFELSSLDDGTTYYYTIYAIDAYGSNDTSSGNFTTDDSTPPTITLGDNSTTSSSITIEWTTDESSSCVLQYGTSTSYGNNETSSGTSHSEELTNLSAETEYYFKITCTDSSSNSNYVTFTITTDEDTTAPEITVTSPESSVKDDDVSFYVTTDEYAKCYYSTSSYIYTDMTSVDSSYSKTHSWEILNQKNGKYTYYITCIDRSSNNATETVTFKVENEVVDETTYGEEETTIQEKNEYEYFNSTLINVSKPMSVHISKGFAMRDVTVIPNTIFKDYKVIIMKILDLTEVNDLDNIIYEAYKIKTEPESTLEIYFDVPESWMKTHKAVPELISVFNFRNDRWEEIKPRITASGSGASHYIATNVNPGYIVIGINSEKLLEYLLEKKKGNSEKKSNDKKKEEKKVVEKKKVSTLKRKTSGISEPIDQEVLIADPYNLNNKSIISFAIVVFIVSIAGALTIAYSSFRKAKYVKDAEKELINEAKEIMRDFYDENIIGDGISPKKRKEEEELAKEFDKLMSERKSSDEIEIEDEIKEVKKEIEITDNIENENEISENEKSIKMIKEEMKQESPKTLKKLDEEMDKIEEYNDMLLDEAMARAMVKGDEKIKKIENLLEKKGYSKEEIDRAMKKGEELLKEHIRYDKVYMKLVKEAVIKMHKQGKSIDEIKRFLRKSHIEDKDINNMLNIIKK